MAKKNGIKEAANILAGLPLENRKKVIEHMRKQNSEMTENILSELVIFEDLLYLTPSMIGDLLKEIKIDDLALALRAASNELKEHFLKNVSKGNASDIKEVLSGPPKPLAKVQEVTDNIMNTVKSMIDKGKLVIDKSGADTLV